MEASDVGNATRNDSTDVCAPGYLWWQQKCVSEEDYVTEIEDYAFPNTYEWFLYALYALVFVVGLVGNFLVCLAVFRNPHMQTVTNIFIVNLAIADFMVILICLPPTLIWDTWETWFFGYTLCKLIVYLQSVSVSVSIFTLSAISVERWYAICHPLKFKATASRARVIVICIWVASILLSVPELFVLSTQPVLDNSHLTVLLTQCSPAWDDTSENAWRIFQVLALYVCPFILMTFAYTQIARQTGVLEYLKNHPALVAFILVSHWLCYFNSSLNPLIYNFMSAKFRHEYRAAMRCCFRGSSQQAPARRKGSSLPISNYRLATTTRSRPTNATEVISLTEI
ncbi:PREDICTED: orexin receptor type 2-like [Priapulus caudatus]|uniref:Orexin receptor type 2-like n=1 Tax=Priapulus caudatus TaxID=37621 RepID=A0ABM1E1S1_PRICU|nr:PREDICTED: orexin receptor type 2-like [Priapulus caudatus]